MKYWEMIAEALHRDGWSWGMCAVIDAEHGPLHVVDACRDGFRCIARAEDLTVAFLELQFRCSEVEV